MSVRELGEHCLTQLESEGKRHKAKEVELSCPTTVSVEHLRVGTPAEVSDAPRCARAGRPRIGFRQQGISPSLGPMA